MKQRMRVMHGIYLYAQKDELFSHLAAAKRHVILSFVCYLALQLPQKDKLFSHLCATLRSRQFRKTIIALISVPSCASPRWGKVLLSFVCYLALAQKDNGKCCICMDQKDSAKETIGKIRIQQKSLVYVFKRMFLVFK